LILANQGPGWRPVGTSLNRCETIPGPARQPSTRGRFQGSRGRVSTWHRLRPRSPLERRARPGRCADVVPSAARAERKPHHRRPGPGTRRRARSPGRELRPANSAGRAGMPAGRLPQGLLGSQGLVAQHRRAASPVYRQARRGQGSARPRRSASPARASTSPSRVCGGRAAAAADRRGQARPWGGPWERAAPAAVAAPGRFSGESGGVAAARQMARSLSLTAETNRLGHGRASAGHHSGAAAGSSATPRIHRFEHLLRYRMPSL